MDSQPSEINARLEKLERENRWMKKIGVVAVVFASVLFISGQSKTNKVLEVNEFHLVDASGKVRAKLVMGGLSLQGPELSFDAEGQSRISIVASDDQARINLNSSRGTMSSMMWAGSPGSGTGSGVAVMGPAGLFRVLLDSVTIGGADCTRGQGRLLHAYRQDRPCGHEDRKERTNASGIAGAIRQREEGAVVGSLVVRRQTW
jgi:hypothetical protein